MCGSGHGDTGLVGPFTNGMRRGYFGKIEVVELNLPYSNYLNFISRSIIFLKFAYQSIILSLKEEYDLVFATSTPLTAGIPGIFSRWLRKKTFVLRLEICGQNFQKQWGSLKILWFCLSCQVWNGYLTNQLIV